MEIVIRNNQGEINAYNKRTGEIYAIDEVHSMASRGDAAAQKAMGDYYHETSDIDEAVAWHRKAAENGHAEAQWNLGVRYLSGVLGVKKDLRQAEHWFRKSAEQGYADGQFGVGYCYLVRRDYVNAKYWAEKAAAQGHIEAKKAAESVSFFVEANFTAEQYAESARRTQEKERVAEEERAKSLSSLHGCIPGSLSAGSSHSAGLKADGTVAAVGDNSAGQCNVGGWRDIVLVSSGDNCTFGLKRDGTVVATGDNSAGQCNVGGWRGITSISAKGRHVAGLKSDGTVVAAGDNIKGQCSVGGWRDIISVSAKDSYTVGVKADGTVIRTWLDLGGAKRDAWLDLSSAKLDAWHAWQDSIGAAPEERKPEGEYCPFYEWDENVCNPGKSDQNPTGDVGSDYKPYCRGDSNWRTCDIYQRALEMQKMLNEMMGTNVKPRWL